MSGEYLAYLAWFNIPTPDGSPTLGVDKEDLERWFKELDLDSEFLPKSIKTIDAFKQATSATSEVYTSDDGLRYRLTVVNHKIDAETVARHVMRHGLSDGATSERVANITFHRPRRRTAGRAHGTEDVKFQLHSGLGGVDRRMVQAFINECLGRYERTLAQLTPHKVRTILRDYLSYLGAVRAPGEGLYFMPLDAHEEVTRLKAVVSRCGDRCRLTLIPLVDGPEYREMLREAIDLDVDTRARRALQEISEWRESHPDPRQVPGRLTTRGWRNELRGLQSQMIKFGDMYGMTFPTAADSLEDLTAAVERLAQRFVSSGS